MIYRCQLVQVIPYEISQKKNKKKKTKHCNDVASPVTAGFLVLRDSRREPVYQVAKTVSNASLTSYFLKICASRLKTCKNYCAVSTGVSELSSDLLQDLTRCSQMV